MPKIEYRSYRLSDRGVWLPALAGPRPRPADSDPVVPFVRADLVQVQILSLGQPAWINVAPEDVRLVPEAEIPIHPPGWTGPADPAAWEQQERAIAEAFSRRPDPDVAVLRFWWDRVPQLRPDFRRTFLCMCVHPDVLAHWHDSEAKHE